MTPAFSLCMPFWNNHGMLERHYENWVEYPRRLAEQLEVSICDDASDFGISVELCGILQQINRIKPPHVLWSQCCATNIAVWASSADWLLLTDMDHIVTQSTWDDLVSRRATLDPRTIYTFKRMNVDGLPYKPHPNSWLMHRNMWEASKGHDERYRGYYNQDHSFRMRLERVCQTFVVLPHQLIRVGRETVADASSPPAARADREADKEKVSALRKQFAAAGTFFDRHQLTAPFERWY